MKRMLKKYQISKFKRFLDGMFYGIISIISILLCLYSLTTDQATETAVILPFLIAICSMLIGLFRMFHGVEPQHHRIS